MGQALGRRGQPTRPEVTRSTSARSQGLRRAETDRVAVEGCWCRSDRMYFKRYVVEKKWVFWNGKQVVFGLKPDDKRCHLSGVA